ncbi:MAG: hypothetical protein L7F77_15650 [Candidatus Magnetominusculus sp. LBB02]|nr:hypothetical protein [Candidatus Magnetominusculus sp. LBB02]
MSNKSAFIFLNRENEFDVLSPVGIKDWIRANYSPDSQWDGGLLLRKN